MPIERKISFISCIGDFYYLCVESYDVRESNKLESFDVGLYVLVGTLRDVVEFDLIYCALLTFIGICRLGLLSGYN